MNIKLLYKSAEMIKDGFSNAHPKVSLILGSGWNVIAEMFDSSYSVNYTNIPCMGATGVKGHAGKLTVATISGVEVLIFQGRRHWYEGVGWESVAFPIFFSKLMNVRTILLTNAAGSLRKDMTPGSLMLIDDHLNKMDSNPLIGPHDAFWGPRFPDQSTVYNKALRSILSESATETNLQIKHGVYVAVSGPTYETPAEVKAFRKLGGDAIGMSTVPEAILANSADMEVAGISCITNFASGITEKPLSHDEVIEQTQKIQSDTKQLLRHFFQHLSTNDDN